VENKMRALRYLYKNINLLNILLLLMIVSVTVFAVLPLFRMKVRYTLPAGKTKMVEQPAVSKEAAPATSPADYVIISENNLFHPDRKIPPEKKEEKLLPKPELVLYGTVISDGASVAYVEDKKSPKTSPGRGKRQAVVRKGDVLGGFILKDIETDRIVLSRGEEIMVVRLTEAGKHREGPITGASGRPSPSFPGAAGSPGAPGPFPSPASPNPVAPRPVASPALTPAPVAVPPPTPNSPGVSSRQQRLLEVQQMKAARPTGP
jgi:hypothetical protein